MGSKLELRSFPRSVTFDGVEYRITFGSDVSRRDGVYLEAAIGDSDPLLQVAEVFYSDTSKRFFVSCFEELVPLELIEFMIVEAKRCLPEVAR